jgi:hypothetical protein
LDFVEVASTVILAGGVTTGAVLSGPVAAGGGTGAVTVTVCVAVALLPLASVAVHITVVDPSGNNAGALLLVITGVNKSLLVVVPNVTAVAVALTTETFAGAVIAGAVVSVIVTVKEIQLNI